jgi:predicted transcriptional regulator
MEQTDIENMSPRELFRELGLTGRKIRAAQKAMQAAKETYEKAIQEIAEKARPEGVAWFCEKYLRAEKDAVTACISVFEDLQEQYNMVGREVDVRKMEIDQDKIKMGLS